MIGLQICNYYMNGLFFQRIKKKNRRNNLGQGKQGQGSRGNLPPIGFGSGHHPFYKSMPKEPYYEDYQ